MGIYLNSCIHMYIHIRRILYVNVQYTYMYIVVHYLSYTFLSTHLCVQDRYQC